MRIVFDRGCLRLQVDPGDGLHSEALDTWREASDLSRTCLDVLPANQADDCCRQLAETATHALSAGRDDAVIASFRKVETGLRAADEAIRSAIINDIVAIFLICFGSGFTAGILWIWMEPYRLWNFLPNELTNAVNYILLFIGWTGFTLIGFSIGWYFLKTGMIRVLDREAAVKQAISLRQRMAHVGYNASLCLVVVIVMFFFGGFENVDEALSRQLTSAPSAVLLGLVIGVAEPAVFERIRGFLKLS
ncbi:hypothetical protein PZ897_04285 [Hoeflea sp. YIM 152468]|uniref:hypothetical protein n=1 Tax=Hoeflea sp. YIM 152468 TaxID=3031759 RepID=UPI0023DA76E4|nr:hypothetical protein [Hoeflea sp. YIM 152468]MDF1607386.1 hypothetical protein [Hoeflea sp. YIM 152468]